MLEKQKGNNMALRLEWTTITELSIPVAFQQALSFYTGLKQERLHRCTKTLPFINDAQELINQYYQLAFVLILISSLNGMDLR